MTKLEYLPGLAVWYARHLRPEYGKYRDPQEAMQKAIDSHGTIAMQPSQICIECGTSFGKQTCGDATWHRDTCHICGEIELVTEPRGFGYLEDFWTERATLECEKAIVCWQFAICPDDSEIARMAKFLSSKLGSWELFSWAKQCEYWG